MGKFTLWSFVILLVSVPFSEPMFADEPGNTVDYPDLDEYNDVGSNLVRDSDAGYSNRISLRMLFKKRQTNSGTCRPIDYSKRVKCNLSHPHEVLVNLANEPLLDDRKKRSDNLIFKIHRCLKSIYDNNYCTPIKVQEECVEVDLNNSNERAFVTFYHHTSCNVTRGAGLSSPFYKIVRKCKNNACSERSVSRSKLQLGIV